MNFDRNADRNTPSSRRRPAKPASTAAVPISVYRELAAELQATQAMVDSLHGQNQHLRKQNLHLQQEVDSIVQAAQKMQNMVGGTSEQPAAVTTPQQQPRAQPQSPHWPQTEHLEHSAGGSDGQASASARSQPNRQQMSSPPMQPVVMPPRVAEPPSAQEMPHTPQRVEPLAMRAIPPQQRMQNGEMLLQENVSALSKPISSKKPGTFLSVERRQMAVETLNKIFTGREQPLPRHSSSETSSEEISMGWLVLIVFFVVVTAFGTGFVIVRPFLSQNR